MFKKMEIKKVLKDNIVELKYEVWGPFTFTSYIMLGV